MEPPVQMSLQKEFFTSSPYIRHDIGSPESPKTHITPAEPDKYDSGKGSIASSDISTSSRGIDRPVDSHKLIDLDRSVKKPSGAWDTIADFDPLAQTTTYQQQSEDSLFSSGHSTFSTSPDAHHPTGVSPRQSFSHIADYSQPASPGGSIVRPRYRPGSTHSGTSTSSLHRQGSGPLPGASRLNRSASGKLRQQSSHSPTGSVQSLPQYPTYATPNDWDISFYSDSSATGSMQGSAQDLTGLDFDQNLYTFDSPLGNLQWP